MKKLHISKRTMIVIGLLLLAACIASTAGVYAKYVHSIKSPNAPISSKTFYFTSNYLTEDNHEYKLNAGTSEVKIELYNYENPLLISEVECSYSVKVVTTDESVSINDIAGKEYVCAYNYNGSSMQIQTDIRLSGLENGKTYEVIVTANGGYVKTLSATFTVADSPDGFYMNVDDTTDPYYIVLTVWTENITGTVNVTFPAGLIPDTTNPMLAAVNNYIGGSYVSASFSDNVNFTTSYSSYSYRFFKTSGYNYIQGTFIVKLGEKPATQANIP